MGFQGTFEIEDPVVPAALNALRDLDGYADMFGNQNFCACDHCRSVYSPGAYFVDLMRFIAREITEPVFDDQGRADHPLVLHRRRPDLWSLSLSCQNTDTTIPYLVIVNEALGRVLADTFGDPDTDRAMSTLEGSFNQPLNLAFSELELYLERLGLGISDVAVYLELPEAERVRLSLGLAPQQQEILFVAAPQDAPGRFGFTGRLNSFPVPDILRRTGFGRRMPDRLIALPVIAGGLDVSIDRNSVVGDVFGFTETLEIEFAGSTSQSQRRSLARQMLDRMQRLVRLTQHLKWPPEAIDFLIRQTLEGTDTDLSEDDPETQGEVLGAAIGQDLARRIAHLRSLRDRLKLDLSDTLALAAVLPPALEPNTSGLANRVMGGQAMLDIRHPDLGNDGGVTGDEAGLSALQAVLRLRRHDVITLVTGVLDAAEIAAGQRHPLGRIECANSCLRHRPKPVFLGRRNEIGG